MSTFQETLTKIHDEFLVIPTVFTVGSHRNEIGQNLGSLTILAYASYRGLTVENTLPLFGEHYEAVKSDPQGTDHKNIRALMKEKGVQSIENVVNFQSVPMIDRKAIDNWLENRANVNKDTPNIHLDNIIASLDAGYIRVATRGDDGVWTTDQSIKKAILLYFALNDNKPIYGGDLAFYDKVPVKFSSKRTRCSFEESDVRIVPPAIPRRGSYIAKGVVLMPSFVNIGAHVDAGTMVDTWVTVGSCAQIGKNVHLSGGVVIGGVLEPLQANPTIIEDNCFIGAGSGVVEGVIVREGAVLSMGVYIGKNTPIVDRTDGNKILRGEVPSRAVVMSGVHPTNGLMCPHIIKYRDDKTDAATALNDILRN